MKKPMIAIPIGDPAGVGPEITVKALATELVSETADCIVIGDRKVMEKAIEITGVGLKVNVVKDPSEGDYAKGVLNLIDLDNIDMSTFRYGVVQAMCGKAALSWQWQARRTQWPQPPSTRKRSMPQRFRLSATPRFSEHSPAQKTR